MKNNVKVQQQQGKIIKEVAVSLQIARSTTEQPGNAAAVPCSSMKNYVNVQFARNYQDIVAIGINL